MADIGDVTATLAAMAAAAVYPNGLTDNSVAGGLGDIKVFEGWPVPDALDADLAAGRTNVSVFPMGGGTGNCFQVLNEAYVVVPAIHGMSATIGRSGITGTVTIAGAPGQGEYLTIVADGKHAYSRSGATLALILAALQTDALADYSPVTVTSNTISLPTTRIVAHIGAPATMGRVTHRQKDFVNITTWAPTPALRNTIASAIDVALKKVNRLRLPDTSQAILTFSHPLQRDEGETKSIYRRDLVYAVEYATLEMFLGWEVTSVNPTYDDGPSGGDASNVFTNAAG